MDIDKQKEIALRAFLDNQVKDQYGVDYTIKTHPDNNPMFEISFSRKAFNCILVRVLDIDNEDLEYSKFEVLIYEDYYEDFSIYADNLAEFWKAVLWQLDENIKGKTQ